MRGRRSARNARSPGESAPSNPSMSNVRGAFPRPRHASRWRRGAGSCGQRRRRRRCRQWRRGWAWPWPCAGEPVKAVGGGIRRDEVPGRRHHRDHPPTPTSAPTSRQQPPTKSHFVITVQVKIFPITRPLRPENSVLPLEVVDLISEPLHAPLKQIRRFPYRLHLQLYTVQPISHQRGNQSLMPYMWS